MKVRSASQHVEPPASEESGVPLEVKNRGAEIERVLLRLRTLLQPHKESARRMGVALEREDLLSVLDALLADADGKNPELLLESKDPVRAYLRRSMFDDLVGEPSNILYSTKVNPDTIRYEAMPAEFWKECILRLRGEV